MPHLTIEYSANLHGLPEEQLLERLNAAVCSHPTILEEADLKARIAALPRYRIGLHPENRAFVHAELRLMAGRAPEVKKELSDRIAAVLQATVPQPEGVVVQLSVDIADMDRNSYFKGKL
ncbi:MAG: 5-carboxymethyl-2-hydroxymuconate Delta-isomerase [Comamonas sp.]